MAYAKGLVVCTIGLQLIKLDVLGKEAKWWSQVQGLLEVGTL
eukprot:CAMPEP_0170648068 /NCGR_PEP_ID=MMETSP0224-20130122/44537_1 /TAXON_ID=285029 /ORGANISM="Togula jolla, Strain CCCM 725" /LENGTH=41 /DNA_ID= /DNA_START= /DNA_END= /DNA_ORIENTATION=